MDSKKIWFVTGASKGLGLTLVKRLLNEGHKVVATSRSERSLISELGQASDSFLPLEVNLVDDENVKSAIEKSVDHFGKIDVVVNNAGYGQTGTLEELSDKEARTNFDVNVFGSLNVIRNVMPYLREQKSGQIFNIASVGGFIANFPSFGIYCATKFAVAGFTEALSAEAKSFNVNATVVYPGYFRTNFLEKDSLNLPKNPIAAYEEARALEKAHVDEITGNQPGDPEKAAAVLIEVANQENPPLHLFLGSDAYNMAKSKMEAVQEDLSKNEKLGLSTDYEN